MTGMAVFHQMARQHHYISDERHPEDLHILIPSYPM